MATSRRALIVALPMMAATLFSARTAFAAGPQVLSPMDERAWREAFAATQRGDFVAADAAMARVADKALAGHLALLKLMHPTAWTASYEDLTGWLKRYGDLPGAERVYSLAVKRKPAGTADPKPPAFMEVTRLWGRVETASGLAGGPASPDRGRAAREAYYSGDAARALALAPAAGERWVAGLAAWRLERYDEARAWFRGVALDEDEDEWLRAGGAFWAARAASKLGDADQSVAFLRMAARAPHTFYGMVAARGLELGGQRLAAGDWRPAMARAVGEFGLTRAATEPAVPTLTSFVKSNPRAKRATALMQIGRPAEAGLELRAGLTLARTPAERQQWQALILALNAPITTAADAAPTPSARRPPSRRPPETYPAPELWPEGGFTLDKALVYALVWKESRFNAFAVSGAGAMGLMQVRPVAAARAAGDDKLLVNPMPLLDAPTNLRVGQDYFIWLMERALGGGPEAYDVLRAVAAYNAGAGTVLNTLKKIGPDADSLLVMESLPALETRDYVEKVMVAYWTYKRRFGGETQTLDAVARGERIIDLRLDR
ncbi:MAG: lytic transglycosylase domain-containing protein [Caulobacter sp.]|nr:lytic transglycosylase domain-containing protein [Caulobacter sp.]